jgi:hypothetical protein
LVDFEGFKRYIKFLSMLLTPHTLVGIAIGTVIQNPAIAVPISFLSHYVGDVMPHWDFFSHTSREERLRGWRPIAVMADMTIGVAVGLTATFYALWALNNSALAIRIFLCGIAAVLPDVLEAPHIYMQKDPRGLGTLTKIQKKLQVQAPLPWGIISQLLVILASVSLIYSSLR